MLRPWTQLSASPSTVLFRWNVVDHVDHAAPRAPRRGTTARPRKGMTRSQGRLDSCFPRGGEYDCTRVYWFVCRRRRITRGVGDWRDGLANGGSSMGAVRPPRHHYRPREARPRGTTGAALGGWSKKTRG